jgi:hypothetical protein
VLRDGAVPPTGIGEGQRKGNQAEFGVPFQAMCFHLIFDVISLSMVETLAWRCGVDFGWIVLPPSAPHVLLFSRDIIRNQRRFLR